MTDLPEMRRSDRAAPEASEQERWYGAMPLWGLILISPLVCWALWADPDYRGGVMYFVALGVLYSWGAAIVLRIRRGRWPPGSHRTPRAPFRFGNPFKDHNRWPAGHPYARPRKGDSC